MTITVYGAGAIGGATGAALIRAGHDVLLVDRAEDHVAVMNARGLTIESRDGAFTVPVRAITPDESGRRQMGWTNLDELVAASPATR